MAKCKKCGKRGLFLYVDSETGFCVDCHQKALREKMSARPPMPAPKSNEKTITIPTVYIGNSMKSKLLETFEDVELQKPTSIPNFSKISLCDHVKFQVINGIVTAKHYNEILGYITDTHLASALKSSLQEKRPIFSQIQGYDDETGEIHLAIATYKIVAYDYDQYEEDRDASLEYENVDYY